MKLHLVKLNDFPNFATDGAGFLWKKVGKNYKPMRPMKHPLGNNVYFVVAINKENRRSTTASTSCLTPRSESRSLTTTSAPLGVSWWNTNN